MKKAIIYYVVMSVLVISCGTTKQSVNYLELAESSYEKGNFQHAVSQIEKYLNEQELKGDKADPKAYSDLAEAYFQMGNMSEAERYYDWAMTNYAVSQNLNVDMSYYYRDIDNLSREITALEYYRDHHNNGADSLMMRNRLFETYIKSKNWKLAQQAWKHLNEETQNKEQYLQMYFQLNREMEQDKQCDEAAQQLLKLNSDHKEALEWMAKKYYDLGENRYQSAMAAYNKKKTSKNYKILLKELDQVTADLKKSLSYFDKLWEMEDGKKYAIYLANIYVRFDDKKKADYYKSFIR